jgi:hypothetical protein
MPKQALHALLTHVSAYVRPCCYNIMCASVCVCATVETNIHGGTAAVHIHQIDFVMVYAEG